MALATGRGQACESNRTGVARMAFGAGADGAIVIGLADCVALLTTGRGCRMSFRKHKRVRRALCATRLELFAEGNLLGTQAFLTVDGGPTRGGVAAAEEFLIDAFVAGAAIAGGQVSTDNESMVIDLLLAGAGLVAVEAIDVFLRVGGHFVFMHNRILQARVALSALSRCPNKVSRRLRSLDTGALSIDQKRGQDQRKCDDNSQKHRTKRHEDAPG